MHQKSFASPVLLPHREVQRGVFFDQHLDFHALHSYDFILNFILHGHVGNRQQLSEFDLLAFSGLQSIRDRLQHTHLVQTSK
jgi:hypothetical protein